MSGSYVALKRKKYCFQSLANNKYKYFSNVFRSLNAFYLREKAIEENNSAK